MKTWWLGQSRAVCAVEPPLFAAAMPRCVETGASPGHNANTWGQPTAGQALPQPPFICRVCLFVRELQPQHLAKARSYGLRV
jgi:hypothetical protein